MLSRTNVQSYDNMQNIVTKSYLIGLNIFFQ